MWLELEGKFRVVHACWDTNNIDSLQNMWKGRSIPKDAWEACKKNGAFWEDIEIILKGRKIISLVVHYLRIKITMINLR